MMIPFSELNIIRGASHGAIREEGDISNSIIQDWLTRNFGNNPNPIIAAPETYKERSMTLDK